MKIVAKWFDKDKRHHDQESSCDTDDIDIVGQSLELLIANLGIKDYGVMIDILHSFPIIK